MHTIELKDTIEYKICSNWFKVFFIISLILFSIFIGIFISLFCSVPFEYAFPYTIACCVVFLPSFWIFIYLPVKYQKKKKHLIKNYSNYIEMEVSLSIPITVRGSAVKYLIKIKEENGREKEIESHSYSDSTVTGRRMLIGYNSATNDIIFLKNI
ncbi:MAG: hypothetical protein K2M08_04245 [Anaeroplasmataceae bacterium]|nr:hypothetical protein [Anaeroplasmataceae bacterium]